MLNPFKKRGTEVYRVLIIGIIIFCCAIIISVSSLAYIFSERYYRQSVSETLNDPYVMLRQQERDYEKNVIAIFSKYKDLKKNDAVKANELKEELLQLNVPASYRDQHFKLIIALEDLSKGQKTKNTDKQVQFLKTNALWLGNLLSKFIINNW